jgi:hypothetical protein
LTHLLLAVIVLAREVEAKNFVLNMRHLGRREPVVQPATSQRRRWRVKRILLVMSVAALMAAMVVATAMPALAASGGVPTGNAPIAGCPSGGGSNFVEEPNEAVDVTSGAPSVSVNSDDNLCSKTLTNFPQGNEPVKVVRDNTVSGPK